MLQMSWKVDRVRQVAPSSITSDSMQETRQVSSSEHSSGLYVAPSRVRLSSWSSSLVPPSTPATWLMLKSAIAPFQIFFLSRYMAPQLRCTVLEAIVAISLILDRVEPGRRD